MDEINPLKNPEAYQAKVLELMKAYELLIGELYAVYAEKFPEHKDFWLEISKEEEMHAYWLETLTNQIGNGKVYFNEERFNIAPLNGCIDEIGIMIATAKNEIISSIEAVSCSMSVESGMIERKFFEVFESDSVEIKKTFNMLRAATMEHGNKVKAIWNTERLGVKEVKVGFWQKIKNFF